MRINAYLEISAGANGGLVIRCRECNAELGPAGESYKNFATEVRKPLSAFGIEYAAKDRRDDPFELREYTCPSCAVLLDTDVARRSDPVLHDVELRIGPDQ